MLLIAHQCGEDKFPRFTVASAKQSLSDGASYVELDVRRTSDFGLAVSHDENAFDLFGVDRNISDMTVAEFKALPRKVSWEYFGITVEDMLSEGVKKILFHVKEGGELLTKILEVCKKYGALDDICIGVSTLDEAHLAKKFYPKVKVMSFVPDISGLSDFCDDPGIDIIRIREAWFTPQLVEKVHACGKKCFVMAMDNRNHCGYTSEENLRLFRDSGADGVLVNNVELAKVALSD